MSGYDLLPSCSVCRRQSAADTMIRHPDAVPITDSRWLPRQPAAHRGLCSEILRATGDVAAARDALAAIQAGCRHLGGAASDYEYVPGCGRDHWWWCRICMMTVYVKPAWPIAEPALSPIEELHRLGLSIDVEKTPIVGGDPGNREHVAAVRRLAAYLSGGSASGVEASG